MRKFIVLLILIILVVIGAYFLAQSSSKSVTVTPSPNVATTTVPVPTNIPVMVTEEPEDKSKTVIGQSVEGREITAYHYPPTRVSAEGDKEILFVGGIHGGYSWNTTLVAYELMDYLKANPEVIPDEVKVTVIPVLNPDGLTKVVGTTTERFTAADVSTSSELKVSGRFNANLVDLNRNFDCDWQTSAKWRNTTVSGGREVFSEPESRALRNYVEAHRPSAAVVWYSAAGGVFASSCHNDVSPETLAITDLYAKAAGYKAYEDFDFYEVTGDLVNWLAKNNIPAISVLLSTHDAVEWDKNRKGIEALLKHYTVSL